MEGSKSGWDGRQFYPTFFAGLWLFLTFLNIPYFLAAANLQPSQFLFLDDLLVDLHFGIHHGLIGYITLSVGILGLQLSTRIRRKRVRDYLFLVSLFFLIKGSYIFFEDLFNEQIIHQTVEREYIWDWKAPQVEVFSLVAFVPVAWMDEGIWVLAFAAPAVLISFFFTPFAPITVALLILLFIYEEVERHSNPGPDGVAADWGVYRWSNIVAGGGLAFVSFLVLVGELGVNLW